LKLAVHIFFLHLDIGRSINRHDGELQIKLMGRVYDFEGGEIRRRGGIALV
jgi:hypothetical protein